MITVPKIQIGLKKEFETVSLVIVSNIFLWSPFESDLVRVTKSGYAVEYEIKLSRADFKADFKKSKLLVDGFVDRKVKYCNISKHKLLVDGFGPTEFYYVFPAGLISHADIPEWAGIIEVTEHISDIFKKGYRLGFNCVRKSKRLNKSKLLDHKLKDIYVSCYYRYWSEVDKRNNNQILML